MLASHPVTRPHWPRLALAASATLLLMVAFLLGLIRLLPARRPVPVEPPPLAQVAPTPLPVVEKPKPVLEPPPIGPSAGRLARPVLLPEPPLPATLPSVERPPPRPPETVVRIDPVPKKAPAPAALPKDDTPDLQVGDEFFQEVVISRQSTYSSLAGDMGQSVRYALLSRFRVLERKKNGGLVVRQTVEAVRLKDADRALQVRLNALLEKTKGAAFTLELSPERLVTRFEGKREAPQVFAGGNPVGGQTFLLWSFLDADGWKELAELSFFRPPQPLRAGEKWSRPLTHSWGPLGSWVGRTGYAHTGKQAGLERYQYVLALAHRPPAAGASGLPFEIGKADFRIRTAGGTIAFDASKGRVAAFEERFHVLGAITVSALGIVTTITMDEAQVFQVRLLDRNPWKE